MEFHFIVSEPVRPFSIVRDFKAGLNAEQREWWDFYLNQGIVQEITNYLNANNTVDKVDEAMAFAEEMVVAAIDGTAISFSPFFKYPLGSNYSIIYPNTTNFLKNEIPKAKTNLNIINQIVEITGLTPGRIRHDLTWGKGPIIQISQLDNACPACDDLTAGMFDPNDPNKLHLDIDLVNLIESGNLSANDSNQLQFFLQL